MKAFPISYEKGVPFWVRKLAVDFTNWYLDNYEVNHQVKIRLDNAGYLDPEDGTLAYAVFFRRQNGHLGIRIATRWQEWKRDRRIKTRNQGYLLILDSLAHELSEYDKWRRVGKASNHRGIQQRVNSLIRRFEHEHKAHL